MQVSIFGKNIYFFVLFFGRFIHETYAVRIHNLDTKREVKMLFNVLIWIIFGVLAGLIVNFIYPIEGKYLPGTIAAGIVGAFVGGVLYSGLQIGQIAFDLDPIATIIALLGSVFLVYFIRALIRFDEQKFNDSD